MTDVLARSAKCPECRHEIEDHWSLAMTEAEHAEWKRIHVAGVCHRSRGEVLRLIAMRP